MRYLKNWRLVASIITLLVPGLTNGASLVADPTSLELNAMPGVYVLTVLTITSSGPVISDVRVSTDQPWLAVLETHPTTPFILTVFANAQALAAGEYIGAIHVTAAGADNSPVSVPVRFTVMQDTPEPVSCTMALIGLSTFWLVQSRKLRSSGLR